MSTRAIVCAHLSAYGREGSRRTWPGYDYLMQAEAGYLAVTGEPDGPPTRFGLSVVDMMTGLMAGFALVSGVLGARATGRGMDLDVNLFETALHNLTYLAAWQANAGHAQGREQRGAHPSLTPSQLYRTRDGWIFIMCNKEKFWPPLAERLGHPGWAADPRFATFAARLAHREDLTRLMDEAFSARDTAEWLARAAGRGAGRAGARCGAGDGEPLRRRARRGGGFRAARGGRAGAHAARAGARGWRAAARHRRAGAGRGDRGDARPRRAGPRADRGAAQGGRGRLRGGAARGTIVALLRPVFGDSDPCDA